MTKCETKLEAWLLEADKYVGEHQLPHCHISSTNDTANDNTVMLPWQG